MKDYILSIDQGTTSTRVIIFDKNFNFKSSSQKEFKQIFPRDGEVEHDPEEIYESVLFTAKEAIRKAKIKSSQIRSIGITNQRETTVLWDKTNGKPVYNAIVWQDRRTADYCESQRAAGLETLVTAKTGLLLDPYFSATKVKWLLDNVAGARARAERGELAFGTIDSFLLWRLTGGQSHKTDATNASRTMLFNIHDQTRDAELLAELDIPATLLPQVEDSAADFGMAQASLFGAAIPIAGMAGDQQAALIGQCCFEDGMTKSTYGTGCFVIMNTGSLAVKSTSKLLTTVAYRLNGQVTYGLEGSIFIAGAAVQWLRDGLGLIKHAAETEAIATAHPDARGVYLVPAFTGLGAPYWDASARGAILGLTRDTGIADIVTATLQSVCYQTRDLMDAMAGDGVKPTALRVDGGMVANDWIAQCLADLVLIPVVRPRVTETTALGAAYLAGLQSGVFASTSVLAEQWRQEQEFLPQMPEAQSMALYEGWQAAVARVRSA